MRAWRAFISPAGFKNTGFDHGLCKRFPQTDIQGPGFHDDDAASDVAMSEAPASEGRTRKRPKRGQIAAIADKLGHKGVKFALMRIGGTPDGRECEACGVSDKVQDLHFARFMHTR